MASDAKKGPPGGSDSNKPKQSKEWDRCVQRAALTVGAGMIVGAAIGSVLAITVPIVWGTGLSVAWSVKRCRALMRDGIITPEMEKERRERARREREQRRRAQIRVDDKDSDCCKKVEELEKQLRQKCGALQPTDDRVDNADGSVGRSSQESGRPYQSDRSNSPYGDQVEGNRPVEDYYPKEQQDTTKDTEEGYQNAPQPTAKPDAVVDDQKDETLPFCEEDEKDLPYCDEDEEDLPYCDEDEKDLPYCDKDEKDLPYCDEDEKDLPYCDEPQTVKEDGNKTEEITTEPLPSYSTIKLFSTQAPQTANHMNPTEGKCTCDARKIGDMNPCAGCIDLSRRDDGTSVPPHSLKKDESEVRNHNDKSPKVGSAHEAQSEEASSNKYKQNVVASPIESPVVAVKVDSMHDPEDEDRQEFEEDDEEDEDEDYEEEDEEYLEDLVEPTDSEGSNDSGGSESSEISESSSSEEEYYEEFIQNIKHDPNFLDESINEETTFSADTYKKSSWPFSFALPSAEKFQKKTNSFKWPPLPSSIILKPKKESTCTCNTTSMRSTCTCRSEEECTCP